uniref:Uncharacterized protein n=1 Tax=Cyprinus carpio TaxID=7962 RepID=A0A8C2KA34_CYPCA
MHKINFSFYVFFIVITENQHYSCMGRNLSYIPPSIPSSIQTLDFSFNVLKLLQKTVFPVLSFL